MTMQQLIGLGINGSMFLIVLSLGLRATMRDVTALFRDPGLFGRSLLSMNGIMLFVAVLICVIFNPSAPIKIALVALALSPVPPILPTKQMKSGGSEDYTIGLLAGASIASIVVVPLGLLLVNALFGLSLHETMAEIAGVVVGAVMLPLLIGILVRAIAPGFAERIAHPVSLVAMIVLVIACIPVLIASFPAVLKLLGDGLVLGLIAFSVIGLAVGHFLGGPDPDDRTVLALATGARHPGVAMAIAGTNYPDAAQIVLVVVLYHLILATVTAVPYVRWRTRLHSAAVHKEAT